MESMSPPRFLPYEALRRVISLLSDADPGAARSRSGPFEENAPTPIEGEGSEGLLVLGRAVEHIRDTVDAALAVLVRIEGDADGLTLLCADRNSASAGQSDALLAPILGPRHGYSSLRTLIAHGQLALLSDEAEVSLLTMTLRLPPSAAIEVIPLPVLFATHLDGALWGLLLCFPEPIPPTLFADADGDAHREFLLAAAQLLALTLRSRRLDEALRDRTRRTRIAHLTPAIRPPQLGHYREFFESSADGVILLDAEGRVRWLNRAAEQMTGYATAGLAGHLLAELVPEGQRAGLWYAIGLVLADHPVPTSDLPLVSTSSEMLVLSVSTSVIPTQPRYVVLSFRDVTEKRILENELRKTKEFLERLIDSTVDGIIAADIRGQIVLFNQGAARITGYPSDEVIGKLPVWRLYPQDEAKRVMADLRAEEHGGRGRLLQSRQTIIGNHGQEIPVALSASIIYEADREVATVGVLSDLRERLLIEERLLKTEERLAWSEKQALLVELAGTAAHELNQPLTSVMGYAQLLQRQLPREYAEIHEYAEVLVREAERMAEIVRKIGHITRYETKSYVGDARILDLDKATLPLMPSESDDEYIPVSPLLLDDDELAKMDQRQARYHGHVHDDEDADADPPGVDAGPLFRIARSSEKDADSESE